MVQLQEILLPLSSSGHLPQVFKPTVCVYGLIADDFS